MSKSRYLPGTGLYSNLYEKSGITFCTYQPCPGIGSKNCFSNVYEASICQILKIGTKLEESCVMNDDGMKP
jgi:hypothetical protein